MAWQIEHEDIIKIFPVMQSQNFSAEFQALGPSGRD